MALGHLTGSTTWDRIIATRTILMRSLVMYLSLLRLVKKNELYLAIAEAVDEVMSRRRDFLKLVEMHSEC